MDRLEAFEKMLSDIKAQAEYEEEQRTIVEALNLIKCVIGYVMVKQRHWVVNLVAANS